MGGNGGTSTVSEGVARFAVSALTIPINGICPRCGQPFQAPSNLIMDSFANHAAEVSAQRRARHLARMARRRPHLTTPLHVDVCHVPPRSN